MTRPSSQAPPAEGASPPDPAALLAELAPLSPEERLARVRAASDPVAILMALGDAVERAARAEVGPALAASEWVVELADNLGPAVPRARARRARAETLAHAGRFADSLALCSEAASIAAEAGEAVEAARATLVSLQPLALLGRYAEAIAVGEAARAAFLIAGEVVLAARADVSIGATHRMNDQPTEALCCFNRAQPGLVNDPVAFAQLETNRGNALVDLDDFDAADTAFRAAVVALEANGLGWAASIAEGNVAYLAAQQGRLPEALHHYERARRFLERDDAPAAVARLLAEQAATLATLGLPEDARATFVQVLPALDAHGLAVEAARARASLGRVLSQLGQFGESSVVLDAAAVAADRLDQRTLGARIDRNRAELAAAEGRTADARDLVVGALVTLADRPAEAAAGRAQLAHLALDAGDTDAAEEAIAEALPVAEALDLAPVRADLLHARGLLNQRRGAAAAARRDLEDAVAEIERMRGALQAERFRTAFLGRRLPLYEDAVLQALEAGDEGIASAFEMAERAKSRALLDLVGGTLDLGVVPDAGRGDDAGERALVADLARLQAEANWRLSRLADTDPHHHRAASTAGERATTARRWETELDALGDRIAVARGVAGLFAAPVALPEALALVPPEEALVEYFAAGDEVLAFVLRDGRASVVRGLAELGAVAKRVRRFRFQVGRAVAAGARDGAWSGRRHEALLADARRELAALWDELLAPLLPAISDAERLAVVPHGPLHALPFHALWDGERYAIERWEVRYAPSASLLARLAGVKSRLGPRAALVVGVADGLAPRISEEAERVAATLGAAPPLLGDEATYDRVTTAAPRAGAVHLACHGRFAADRSLASGRRLADRWLTVRDIYRLRLEADLVTLSGCETGRSAVDGGDELLGLTRGFFAAGAPSLVTSLWVADDAGTTDLMVDFYAAWQGGATKARALRRAQCAALAERPHPAAWAPFVFGGNP